MTWRFDAAIGQGQQRIGRLQSANTESLPCAILWQILIVSHDFFDALSVDFPHLCLIIPRSFSPCPCPSIPMAPHEFVHALLFVTLCPFPTWWLTFHFPTNISVIFFERPVELDARGSLVLR
jgi:hypothetical protein